MVASTFKNAYILEEHSALALFTICDNQMPNVEAHEYMYL
jgi:hypothetical protein